jgi:hypothetical protein
MEDIFAMKNRKSLPPLTVNQVLFAHKDNTASLVKPLQETALPSSTTRTLD